MPDIAYGIMTNNAKIGIANAEIAIAEAKARGAGQAGALEFLSGGGLSNAVQGIGGAVSAIGGLFN